MSELQRHLFGSPMTDAVGDIVSGDVEDATLLQDAADDDVGVGMASVVMIDRDPVRRVSRSFSICRIRSRVKLFRSAISLESSGATIKRN